MERQPKYMGIRKDVANGYLSRCQLILANLREEANGANVNVQVANVLALIGKVVVFRWEIRSEEDRLELKSTMVRVRAEFEETIKTFSEPFDQIVVASLKGMLDELEAGLVETRGPGGAGDLLDWSSSVDFEMEILDPRDEIHYALTGLRNLGREVPEEIRSKLGALDQELKSLLPDAIDCFRRDGQTMRWRVTASSDEMWWRLAAD